MSQKDGLRIGWVVYGSLEQVSGGYIYDRLVVEALRAAADDVRLISLEPGAPLPDVSAGGFDAIVGDELCFRELPALFERARGARRVLLIHHLTAWEKPPGDERAALLQLEKAAIDSAHVCVVTSRITADRLMAERLVRHVIVAEPGADRLPRPHTGGQEPSSARIRLLFVGNLLPRKGVAELCQAFARLAAPHAELVLVGAELDADYARAVRAIVATAGMAERVKFLGPLSGPGVAEQLQLADALVLPSTLEGYGMVLSEALWASVPVIAARVGAAEQLVGATSAGLLFDPHDAEALGASLSRFVNDAELRARLRRAAFHAAAELPRWRDTASTIRATLLK